MIWKYAPYEKCVRVQFMLMHARTHFFHLNTEHGHQAALVHANLQKQNNEQMINDGTNAGEY